ncbi:MAG: pyridoxamine 5'-phosphate oxidase family protein [Actinomycetes bacterium]
MSSPSVTPLDSEGRPISAPECRAWLAHHREGRLGYRTGRGPRSVVVHYTLSPGRVLLRLPRFSEIVSYVPGERVTLEVDGRSSAEEFETVCVTGTASVADREQESDHLLPLEGEWPAELSTEVISVPLDEIAGFRRRPAPRGTAEPEPASEPTARPAGIG